MPEQLLFIFARRPQIIHLYRKHRRLKGDEMYHIQSTEPWLPTHRTFSRSQARSLARGLVAEMQPGEGNTYIWIAKHSIRIANTKALPQSKSY